MNVGKTTQRHLFSSYQVVPAQEFFPVLKLNETNIRYYPLIAVINYYIGSKYMLFQHYLCTTVVFIHIYYFNIIFFLV